MRELKSKNQPGTAVSRKGSKRIDQIIRAARDVLIRQGYQGFTMRAVAYECNISVGNLNYYYRNKADLFEDLLETVIAGYLADFDVILTDSDSHSPEQSLERIIRFIIADLGTRETTVFFPELWALANHDSRASRRMHELYRKARLVFDELIPQVNPALADAEVKQLSLFVSASLEGHTMFIGHKKAWAKYRQNLSNIAAKGLLDLVRSITPDDIRQGHLAQQKLNA